MVQFTWVAALAMLALLPAGRAAAGSSSVSLPEVVAVKSVPAQPASELGPVVLADGRVVIGLLLKAGRMTFDQVRPGSQVLERLRTESVAGADSKEGEARTTLALQAAGNRYIVARMDFASCAPSTQPPHECLGVPTSVVVTLFGLDGEAPRVLSHCEGEACSTCFGATNASSPSHLWTAASADEVLIDPVCSDGTVGPGVISLSSGATTRFMFPATRYGRAQHGPYEVVGDYIASPDGVLNFRTGAYQILGRGTDWQRFEDGVWGFGLLADGRAAYGFNSNVGHAILAAGQLYESTPGQDDRPLPVSDPGYVDVTHGETIVMHGDSATSIPRSPSEVVRTDGTVLGKLEVDSLFTGFDGRLAAGLEPGCTHDYLLLWDITVGPPATVPAHCAAPRLGPIRLGPRAVSVRASCPVGGGRDCSTLARFPAGYSTPSRRTFRLRHGQHRWYTLRGNLTISRCEALTRTRRVSVEITTADTVTGRRAVEIPTVRRCARRAHKRSG
jgi:hypothetical protein